MKTRDRAGGVPGPRTPWEEITPGLWMGGHVRTDEYGTVHPVVVACGFDVVVSLVDLPGHGPGDPGVEHVVADLPDAPLTAGQLATVARLARGAARVVRDGRTILVRCHAGYNRSGLVVAQTLVELGHDAASAIALVRRHRSPWALNNPVFEQYLRCGLDVAGLLAGLEPRP
ncbi:protein phosphatase [Streptomyces sp. MI02-7b]|uniref:protein-tyrosine phosphatase family protein n=1 Tax=Streptomyces sp. MI02-7b TaxID=462941 RepID=UPI0029B25EB9|nr:protein phosphatase [Streptomyces sp. MI02-7b]MDX3076846.1 protein phosphatase [Streptomyces sp. MI02-7b]